MLISNDYKCHFDKLNNNKINLRENGLIVISTQKLQN